MNASWFKRFIMGHTLDFTRTGYMSDQEIQKFYNETKGMFDSQIVYTVDIPKEVTVNNPSAVLTGLDGFDVTTEVKNNRNSKTLVVSARLNSAKQAKPELWKNTIEKLKKLDTSNVKMSVSGLSVSSSASLDSTVTLKGTVAGYFEWALSGNSDFSAGNPDASHTYLYFIAKQGNAGRDAAAPQNKPNLISYTFKVNKAADKSSSE